MKIIRYSLCIGKVNTGTDEEPVWEDVLSQVEIGCRTEEVYQNNLPIAEKEVYQGEITVEGDFDPEPEDPETEESSMWEELDAAYQEGVDSV